LKQGFDAALVAIGTHKGSVLPLEGSELPDVLVNTDFLKRARMGVETGLGRTVAVLGGGNVAFDCARTALRLGAESVHIACLEAYDAMTAEKEEIEQGVEEGVVLHNSSSFARIVGAERVSGLELQRIESFRFDENGRAELKLVEGSNEIIPVESVIFAVGQKPEGAWDMGLELARGAYIKADSGQAASVPGVFASGDAVTGTKSVVEAIAQGRRSAEAIDRYLGGDGDISERLADYETADPFLGRNPDFAGLARLRPSLLEASARKEGFAEVELAFDGNAAAEEASRCLQCDLRLNLTRPRLWNEYERQVRA
jgi:NADPH-dependent glutamate synthase beta subunit-like oxidoreductase